MRKIYKITSCLVSFLMAFLMTVPAFAQQYHPNTHWPYLLQNFEQGTIYFSNNQKSEAKLNVHLWGNVLHYIHQEGKIFESPDKDVVRVEIGDRAFLFGDHKLMQIVGDKQNKVLLKLTTGDFDSMFSGTGAYGASLSTSATRDLSSLDLGGLDKPDLGKMLQNKEDGREIPLKVNYFFLIDGTLVDASKKGMDSYLEESKKAAWSSFLKANKIKWKSEEGLLKVLDFLAE